MWIRLLPLVIAIVPLVAVAICYRLGVEHAGLPDCIPYIDGCTSISATGRYPPASYLFRAVHLPLASLLAVAWYIAADWLRAFDTGAAGRKPAWILGCGLVAALALIVYVTFLGTEGPTYEFMRRVGIYFYFLGTVIAQLLVSIALRAYARSVSRQEVERIAWPMLALSILPFVLGLLLLALKAILEDPDAWENRLEWIVALGMQLWFMLLYVAWRQTGLDIRVRLGAL